MDASNNGLIKWEYLTYDHTTKYFWGHFATYMGKFERNKTMVNFADGNSSASNKSVRSRKGNKDILLYQGFIPNTCK